MSIQLHLTASNLILLVVTSRVTSANCESVHLPEQEIEDQGDKMTAVEGDLSFESAHGTEGADGSACRAHKPVFHCGAWHAEYPRVQSQEGAGKVAAGVETNQPHMETSIHSDPSSLISGLFKSSWWFCTRMCAYHCSDFYLAGGGTFQGNGWPRITHTNAGWLEQARSSTLSLPKQADMARSWIST